MGVTNEGSEALIAEGGVAQSSIPWPRFFTRERAAMSLLCTGVGRTVSGVSQGNIRRSAGVVN